jgi:hypothetical protein
VARFLLALWDDRDGQTGFLRPKDKRQPMSVSGLTIFIAERQPSQLAASHGQRNRS